ncbi:hypothetical protein QBC47DRAFT_434777 [Echria macrotheca]|uniref:DUF6604 domain-containing protein n=1 Tax=Echria macrotheca TaxID=438768 RepID=A0AAJ0F553_9PEZI|nr:hypothetical protein QBC47DRAFT_434777 [Echria macrotheca]
MASRNIYLAYKRDTSHLIYWMVQTSNAIIKRCGPSKLGDNAPKSLNTSGAVTVAGLVSLAKFIARHLEKTPSPILRLFQSVINARTATHAAFQMMVANNPDPQVAKSNASHKLFIDALNAAFTALGGKAGIEADDGGSSSDEEDPDQLVLANIYLALSLEDEAGNESSDEPDEPAKPSSSAPPRRVQPRPGRGKKGKRGKKKQQKATQPAKESLEDVPIESYRIIQDEEGIVTEYLMAVWDLVKEWVDLRHTLQDIWREVAYDGLNSAVAGTVSNVAISMVRQSAASMFVDFPGHDTYEIVMNTITRGNVDKAQGNYTVSLFQLAHDGSKASTIRQTSIDVREEFLIRAYRDLLDFIADFQQTRSGKPTRRMLAEIKDWDPNFNLERATNEERIRWRRAYTINWLYDLVNVFSSVVVQRINLKGERHVLEEVDWSVRGPWGEHRVIFGINEFAADVTTWAMQKPGTDVRGRILPHHVFQLQIIVDALAVSRGWSISVLRGHILTPPARGYRPRRDVDLFVDRENKRCGQGFLQGADVLKQILDQPQIRPSVASGRHGQVTEMLEGFMWDFCHWLGESMYKYGLNTIPPSRFSHADSNGLWEYSPFLCGDQVPEVMCAVHLHNMLVQRRYIKQPVGLYASLAEIFPYSFFKDGKAPESDFVKGLIDLIGPATSRRSTRNRTAHHREIATTASSTIHELFTTDINMFFKDKSLLVALRRANWIPENIADENIPIPSVLCALRLASMKKVPSEAEETVLMRRMRSSPRASRKKDAGDWLDKTFWSGRELLAVDEQPVDQAARERVRDLLAEEFAGFTDKDGQGGRGKNTDQLGASPGFKLTLLKFDIATDVCGRNPISALNCIWVAARIVMLLVSIEENLQKARNPLYCRIYESGAPQHEKRVDLVLGALTGEDEECLRIMAETFESPRAGFMNHIYWNDLDEMHGMGMAKDKGRVTQAELMDDTPDACVVM